MGALYPGEFARSVQDFPTRRPTRGLSEYDHFLALCGIAGTNLENDVWIHEKIQELGGLIEQVPP